MYSFPNFKPVCCFMYSSNCCFLTCIQTSQEAGKVVWYSHLFKNFLQFVIHTVNSCGIVNKAEVDVFLELSCFFYCPMDVGNLILVPLLFPNPAWTSGSSWFMYYWSLAWRILSFTLLAREMSSIVWQFEHLWHCLSLRLEWKLTLSSPVATAEFSKFAGILSAALSQHHLLGFEIAQLESITSTSFVCSDAS